MNFVLYEFSTNGFWSFYSSLGLKVLFYHFHFSDIPIVITCIFVFEGFFC